MTWDKYYLGMAEYVSTKSKDPSTKTGAVIVRPDNTVASIGYNGFPRGIADDDRLQRREDKYSLIIHCEMNAVLSAREPLSGYTLYTWPFCSCDRCAVHMIQAGIKRCVAPKPDNEKLSRWGKAFEITKNIFKEAGVELVEY